MIVYKDLLKKLSDAGYNSTRIRAEAIFPQSTLQRMRKHEIISLDTLDKICHLTGCRIEDLIEHIEEGES